MPPRLGKTHLKSSNRLQYSSFPIRCCQCLRNPSSRSFSATPHHETRQRRVMFRWLQGPGAVFKDPLPGSTNYINAYNADGQLVRLSGRQMKQGDSDDGNSSPMPGEDDTGEVIGEKTEQNIASGQPIPREFSNDLMPFPLNRQFKSQSVLSEALRNEIYVRVVKHGKSVRVVSAEMGVEMARVGAVVRLKAVEEKWLEQGKSLATPYARAIMKMLPQTQFNPDTSTSHESINDLPVHRDTLSQIFLPVSESRQFTRVDAGKAFSRDLKPADERIPHPELIELEKERLAGVPREERIMRQRERMRIELQQKEERAQAKREREERDVTKVVPPQGRWEFRFRDISVESVGRTGRDKRGVGARYGIPHEDRKKGQIKIPTRVE